jgi:hypothetical protein
LEVVDGDGTGGTKVILRIRRTDCRIISDAFNRVKTTDGIGVENLFSFEQRGGKREKCGGD